MATHGPHPDTHEHGLADDCPRCDELAKSPLELDDENFIGNWDRMIRVEYGNESYRSGNEATLGRQLYHWSLFLQRYTPIDPRELVEQFNLSTSSPR